MTAFQKELKFLRSQIDDVDSKLLELLARRVEISSAIAQLKVTNGLPIHEPAREAEIIAGRVSTVKPLKLPEDWLSELFKIILRGCRTISHQRLGNERSSLPQQESD